MNRLSDRFHALVDQFPLSARPLLESIPLQAGVLDASQCEWLMRQLKLGLNGLLVRLLPLARWYAGAPVSHFQTGAVAIAETGPGRGGGSLYLGANLEFVHLDMSQTIHAEQSAVINAWHHGVERIEALAVTAAPCGYCRQFLFETDNSATMRIVTPFGPNGGYRHTRLGDLLPEAFAPAVLGSEARFMAPPGPHRTLSLTAALTDRVVAAAAAAGEHSYAPYTHNYAGCAIQMGSGEVHSGRCVESAAHNPGLTALQSAIMMAHLAQSDRQPAVKRVVLVEKPTTAGQRISSEVLLRSWAPGVELEYVEAASSG